MRAVRLALVACFCIVGVGADVRADPRAAPATVSLAEFVSTLDTPTGDVERLDEKIPGDATTLAREIPVEWTVDTGDRSWTVSGVWIRSELDQWRRAPSAQTRAEIAARLRGLRAQAASYTHPPAQTAPASQTLGRILSSPEFLDVSQPSWLDRLREQVFRWILSLLAAIFGSSSVPTVTNVLVYALIAAAVILVAMWMYRSLRLPVARDTTLLDLHAAPARPWDDWLRDARAASADGDWRQAIRLAYWCGIVFLEARGAWRHDPSRTPREYLHALPSARAADEPALRSLTALVERVWYGTAPATSNAFDEALSHLKMLGCPLP